MSISAQSAKKLRGIELAVSGPKTKRTFFLLLSALVSLQVPLIAMAQPKAAPVAPAAAGGAGIDIKAEEQEFADDHIIARGHVRVLYEDTVVVAPVATLYRDPATGQPQRAVFTGHPHLVQGSNKIDADTLTFEMATSKVIAEGHAHSEVENAAPPAEPVPTPMTAMPTIAGAKLKKVAPANSAEAALAQAAAVKGPLAQQGEANTKIHAGAADAGGTTVATTAASAAANDGPTTIITDSDKQIYERSAGQFEAIGHVKVKAGDIDVISDHLRMAYGVDRKPEAAVFTGHANATQGQNNTQSDTMTYFLNSKRLQATGHVRSKVIQSANSTAAKSDTATAPVNEGKMEPIANGAAPAATTPSAPIIIVSDTQDNNKETGRLDAIGNVKIFYNDTVGIGPKVVMVRNAYGQAEKVVFIGRSQVTQPGKRWIGDRITMTIADKKVLAEGNTKAFILPKKNAPSPGSAPANGFTQQEEFKLAGRPVSENSKVSTTRVERPE